MNRLRLYLLALTALLVCTVKADEGMWLLQLMQQQHSIDMMKKQGLKLEAQDLYNPNGVSLKDAVGIFGGGCTGEIISPEGLILTNHHCGYSSIQQHSSVEHDYLTDGFGHTIDGCAQQNFITYDVQTEFSPLFFVSDVVLCLKTVSEPVYLIELVVVTVVGGGELVENPEKPCRNAGVLVSTGL